MVIIVLLFTVFHRYYSDQDVSHGFYTVSIDNSPPQRLSGQHPVGHVTRQMLWSQTGLSAGQHTLTLTHDDADGKLVTLDYFRCVQFCGPRIIPFNVHSTSGYSSNSILRNEDASALPSDSTITNEAPVTTSGNVSSSGNWSSRLALAIGLPIGVLGLGCVVLFLIFYRRRKRRYRASRDLIQNVHQHQNLSGVIPDPSLAVYRKGAQPVLPYAPTTSTASTADLVYSLSPRVESLGSPEMTNMSSPPPYDDSLQDGGASAPPPMRQRGL
jgi:hypothetical protein